MTSPNSALHRLFAFTGGFRTERKNPLLPVRKSADDAQSGYDEVEAGEIGPVHIKLVVGDQYQEDVQLQGAEAATHSADQKPLHHRLHLGARFLIYFLPVNYRVRDEQEEHHLEEDRERAVGHQHGVLVDASHENLHASVVNRHPIGIVQEHRGDAENQREVADEQDPVDDFETFERLQHRTRIKFVLSIPEHPEGREQA